jgi:hypothetical protein
MFVSGFTIVRNAIKYDYPIVEAIRSILPICDEVVVLVGQSDDETFDLINKLNEPKIRIEHSVWDDSLREGGRVLAVETDKAFALLDPKTDWAFYIQADEVLHEKYHSVVQEAMKKQLNHPKVDGLLFNYKHFYGSYDYIGVSRRWYRKEIRVIRNLPNIQSYRDAQGFRKAGKKLQVVQINAEIYHYGWVKHPEFQQAKQQNFHKMWHDDAWMAESIPQVDAFDYSQIDLLQHFDGTHPLVMKERVDRQNWTFSFDPTKAKWSLKSRLLHAFEKLTHIRPFEYKNYRCIN